MKKYILALSLTLGVVIPVCAQEAVISSYYLDNDYRDCWTEILVVEDDADMRGYRLRDMNSSLTTFNDFISFDNVGFWNHLRAGTVIIIYSASASSAGATHTIDTNKTDGAIQVHAQMTNLFTIPGGTTPWVYRASGQLLDLHGPEREMLTISTLWVIMMAVTSSTALCLLPLTMTMMVVRGKH